MKKFNEWALEKQNENMDSSQIQNLIQKEAMRFRNHLDNVMSELLPSGVSKEEIHNVVLSLLNIPSASPASSNSQNNYYTPNMELKGSDLPSSIFKVFQELSREQFSRTGMVPIHKIRSMISQQLGPEHARHDVFDKAAHKLRQDGKVRMISISDPRKATERELHDSIPGAYETLFYLRSTQ